MADVEKIIEAIAEIVTVAAPIILKGVENGAPFAKEIYALATGTNLTDADIDAALARVNALSAQIQSPDFIPPAQDDDV